MQDESEDSFLMRTLETRKVAALVLHPQHSVFAEPTEVEINLLAASISDRGMQHPLDILPDGVIIGGRKRWLALMENGVEECECWVRHDLAAGGEAAVVRYLVFDNIERRQLTPLEVARAYALAKSTYVRAIDGDPRDMRDVIAERFRLSGGSLDRLCRILDAPRIVQDAFERGEVRQVDAAKVGRLPASVRDAIASEMSGSSTPQDVVNRYLGKKQGLKDDAPANSPAKPAEQALRELIAATSALMKAQDFGDKLAPEQRESVILVSRRLTGYLRQQS